MTTYVVRRLLISIPVLFGIILAVFAITRILPGDACQVLLGERANQAACNAFNQAHGLDKPILEQFGTYVTGLFQGDLGTSFRTSRPVSALLVERIPMTLELSIYALTIATIGGLVLGLLLVFVFANLLKDTPFALPPSGRLTPGVSIVPLAERWGLEDQVGPVRTFVDFVSNMYTLNGLLSAQWDIFADAFRHLILPAIALATIPLAIIARITRSSLLDVLGRDYVRTARAKGLNERAVVLRHGARNALLPVVTIIGLQLGALLSGAVLTETVFNLAGVGRTLYEAITGRDYVVIQGFTLAIAVIYVLVNLLVDLSYGILDPRVRQQ